MMATYEEFKHTDTFRCDFVDVARQSFVNLSDLFFKIMMVDHHTKNKIKFGKSSKKDLDLILKQERILGTHKLFSIGHQIEESSECQNDFINDLFEFNAHAFITTWCGSAP